MKTKPLIEDNPSAGQQEGPKHRSRLATTGAVLVVLLLVGTSALAYALLAPHRQGAGQGTTAASGAWEKVLSGYYVTSLVASPGDPTIVYACAATGQGNGAVSNQAILRSTDGGLHWQNIGSHAGVNSFCQLAVNPGNSNDVYLVTLANPNGQPATRVLKHTTDGGQTWSTIQPVLTGPATNAAAWNITQLSIVDQRLFGIQTLPAPIPPQERKGTVPRYVYNLPRLVTSADGGHTWRVLDQQFSAARQGTGDYAVDPANINIIYDLVSIPWLPIQPAVEPGGNIPSYYGYNATLYKTTDGGATWQPLLDNLPFGSSVRLAANNPQIVYAGGARRALPYTMTAPRTTNPAAISNFQLHMSSDGGASWRDVPPPPGASYPQSWFVNGSGQVYVYAGEMYLQPREPVRGTAVAVTAVTIPNLTPQSGTSSQPHQMPMIRQPAMTPTVTTGATTPGQIERYDPSTNQWSVVTKPPSNGDMLAVTASSGSGDALWFMGIAGKQAMLYRYITA